MAFKYRFTVFTPTYNRANKIYRVYESLISQTFRDFEWLIVDDGSTDNTKKLVYEWQQRADFEIRYIYQSNKGQPAAFNNGVRNANGELFLPADSDDAFIPETLDILNDVWINIEEPEAYSAVTGLCIDSETGKIVGDTYPEDVFDSNYLESRYKYNVSGEKWGFHKTSILREFPFSEDEAYRHIYPGMVWMKIARKYKTRYINVPLRIYYQNEDGTQTANKYKYPDQMMEWYLLDINNNLDYLILNKHRLAESFVNLGKMQALSKYPFTELLGRLNVTSQRLLLVFLYPISLYKAYREGK